MAAIYSMRDGKAVLVVDSIAYVPREVTPDTPPNMIVHFSRKPVDCTPYLGSSTPPGKEAYTAEDLEAFAASLAADPINTD